MDYFCHSCGAKSPYINGLKPKFCSSCGVSLENNVIKPKKQETRAHSTKEDVSRGDWREEWKGKVISGSDDDIDLNEIMRGLKQDNGITVEKDQKLTIGSLKEMDAFDGRDGAQIDKELAPMRAEVLKNLGVPQQ